MKGKRERKPDHEMWEGYYRRRRFWFFAVVPALSLLLALNLMTVPIVDLLVVVSIMLISISIPVAVARWRIRRARGLVGAREAFSAEAVLLGDGIVGTVEPWVTLRNAAGHKQLGLAGVFKVDPQGLHWISSLHRPALQIYLEPTEIERCEFVHLGWWMSGLGVWTTSGERLAILLPRLDRATAERSLALIGLVPGA